VAKPITRKIRLLPNRAAPIRAKPLQPAAPGRPARQAAAKLRPSDPEFWTVINELSDPVPISRPELDALESYFADLLDAVFDRSRNSWP
jgi:hypothetical protein